MDEEYTDPFGGHESKEKEGLKRKKKKKAKVISRRR